jgi:hypothetical protein
MERKSMKETKMNKTAITIWASVIILAMNTGCKHTDGEDGPFSYNMKMSVSRSAGDVAMTALLDEGVSPEKATKYVDGLIQLFDEGTLNKVMLREAAARLANELELGTVADYIDAFIIVIPNEIGEIDNIPQTVRNALVSFLRDGAKRALILYDQNNGNEPIGEATPL